MLTKDVDIVWNVDYQHAFQVLKEKFSNSPVLRGPNWSLPFHISIDASDTALGVALGQREDNFPYAIYFVRKIISLPELNYTVTEKELLAVVHAIGKFRHHITSYETFVHTDQSVVRFLINKPITNGLITIWLFLLQEFNITVIYRPRRNNLAANFLSRLNIAQGSMPTPVPDEFLDEALFSISTITPWFDNVTNYLVLGKLPQNMSAREKHNIVQRSANFP